MSRWTYRTHDVTVGDNTQKVRSLTAGERKQFAAISSEIKSGKKNANELPAMIAGFGCIEPKLSDDELETMPPDLMDACVAKIMELTGFKEDEPEADPEKKAETPSAP